MVGVFCLGSKEKKVYFYFYGGYDLMRGFIDGVIVI